MHLVRHLVCPPRQGDCPAGRALVLAQCRPAAPTLAARAEPPNTSCKLQLSVNVTARAHRETAVGGQDTVPTMPWSSPQRRRWVSPPCGPSCALFVLFRKFCNFHLLTNGSRGVVVVASCSTGDSESPDPGSSSIDNPGGTCFASVLSNAHVFPLSGCVGIWTTP